MPLDELKQATLAKVQEMVSDQADGSPRYQTWIVTPHILYPSHESYIHGMQLI